MSVISERLWSTQQLCALRYADCHGDRSLSTSTAVLDDAVFQEVLVTVILSWAAR